MLDAIALIYIGLLGLLLLSTATVFCSTMDSVQFRPVFLLLAVMSSAVFWIVITAFEDIKQYTKLSSDLMLESDSLKVVWLVAVSACMIAALIKRRSQSVE